MDLIMLGLESLGKYLIIAGVIMIVVGAILFVFGKVPWFGRLPGDIIIRNDNTTVYFPVVTMLLVSVVLTILFNIIGKR
jgi:hypothetical protein